MLIKGQDLTAMQKIEVKNAFVHRLTIENESRIGGFAWFKNVRCNLITDEQWLEKHAFYFLKDGSRLMANRKHCEPYYMGD